MAKKCSVCEQVRKGVPLTACDWCDRTVHVGFHGPASAESCAATYYKSDSFDLVCDNCHPWPALPDGPTTIGARTRGQLARIIAITEPQLTRAHRLAGATLSGRVQALKETLQQSLSESAMYAKIRAANMTAATTLDDEARATLVGRVEGWQWILGDDSYELL